MNKPKPKDEPFTIPKQLVWEAYRRVAANKGAPGVDGQALDEFEADLGNNLYKIWNLHKIILPDEVKTLVFIRDLGYRHTLPLPVADPTAPVSRPSVLV